MRDAGEEIRLFVPGRLCLFGEHSDWAAENGMHPGYCLVIGTDQGLHALAAPSDAFSVVTQLPDSSGRPNGRARQMTCRWEADELLSIAKDDNEFFRYCAGVAYELMSRRDVSRGIDLRITSMDLPLRKGVSSSAAVCILVAKAFNAAYSLGLFPHELMEIAYRGEKLTGSQCGRMDQACIYGKTPVLLTFSKSSDVRVEPLFPAREIAMFFVDLAGSKDTVRILADLQGSYLRDKALQKALGEENERLVRGAYGAIGRGDAETLGALMAEAQEVFDRMVAPCSLEQLAGELLHEVLGMEAIASHVWGGKGVGSQGDGTVQFVARSPVDRDEAIQKILSAHPRMQCFPLTIVATGPKT